MFLYSLYKRSYFPQRFPRTFDSTEVEIECQPIKQIALFFNRDDFKKDLNLAYNNLKSGCLIMRWICKRYYCTSVPA
jgi:hypothetical protein